MMDDDSGFFPDQHIPWPSIRKTEIYSNAADVTGRRLQEYLRAMGFPAELAEQWQARVQHSEENAAQAFVRLRLLISDDGREGTEVTPSGNTDASVMPRLCSWLEPGQVQRPPWIKQLFNSPPIHRRSMAPEGWDD